MTEKNSAETNMNTQDFQIVLSTCPDKKTAIKIATSLLEAKLAVCINIIEGVSSVYTWNGKVEEANESLMIIKSRKSLFTEINDKITMLHPYQVPEIISLSIENMDAKYAIWFEQGLRGV